jgi:hypothetical protein
VTWQTGSATSYKNLLDQMIQVATSDHVSTCAVNAAGTGYVVGDILSVAGGTKTHTATLRVTTVGGGGSVTGLRIETGGAYTANPTLTGNALTGGTGSGCTANLTMADTGWTVKRQTQQAVSATVGAGGSGYTVGDDITIAGGFGVTTAAVFNVDSVSSGAVTAVSLVTAGMYEDVPTNPASVTGGTGTGATLNVTWAAYSGANEKQCILEGVGGGSDEILVGVKTYTQSAGLNTAKNWTLVGMTAYNAGLAFESQAGISPGATPSSAGGAYVPLHDNGGSFPIDFWFSITSRRIIGVAKVENAVRTHYASWYIGWLNQFGTADEYPYPICIAGSSARFDTYFADVELRFSGITEVIGISGRTGPMYYRTTSSAWQTVANSILNDVASPTRSASNSFTLYPSGQTSLSGIATEDNIIGDGSFTWDDVIPPTGVPGTETWQLFDTPNTGDDYKLLVPTCIVSSSGTEQDIVGELDNVYWVSAIGGVTSEDTLVIGTDRYRIFQNGNRTQEFTFMAILEN